jgi:hypothetical protein
VNCPQCGSRERALETRRVPVGLRRRRRCTSCGHAYSTVEQVVPDRARYGEPHVLVPARLLAELRDLAGKIGVPDGVEQENGGKK